MAIHFFNSCKMILKNHLFLFVTLLLTSVFNAQNVHFGIKGGLNISTLTVSGVNVKGDLSYKPGFHIGALVHSAITNQFSIQTELLFSNQGYNYKEANLKLVGNINYLAVPVMMMYYPAKNFSVEVGPQLSFLLSHKAKIDIYQFSEFDPNDPAFSSGGTIDLKDSSQSIEFGMNVGLGYKINKNVFFSGRYNFGITTANKKETGPDASGEEDRNSVFQFSMGYLF